MNERQKQIRLAVDTFTSLVGDVDGVIEVALFGFSGFRYKESISQQWFNALASKSPTL